MSEIIGAAHPRNSGRATAWITRWGPWLALAASGAAYLISSLVIAHAPFHPLGVLRFFDLKVYRGGGRLVLDGAPLYGTHILHFNFTYPPFAALAFVPLAVLPLAVDKVGDTALNLAALVGVLWFALRLPAAGRSGARGSASNWRLVALGVAAALWLEPITTTLAYGQINLVIAFLIVYDLSRSDEARTKGMLIGLAAALKLTPLLFVPYLLLAGRRRAASVALGSFGATIALGYALLPSDSARYWGGLFLDSSRVGGGGAPSNQSVHGELIRLAPSIGQGHWWILIAAITGLIGLALAVLASRRGDEAAGFSLCALTALLVSPVSWNHHWTLAVPALFLLAVGAYRQRSKLNLVAAALVAAVGYSYVIEFISRSSSPDGAGLSMAGQLEAAPFVCVGFAVIAVFLLRDYRTLTARSRRASGVTAVAGVTKASPEPAQG